MAAKISTRHRWGEKVVFDHKSEKQCERCEMVLASHHQAEGPFDRHWKEFWRDCEQIKIEGNTTPPCDARLEAQKLEGVA